MTKKPATIFDFINGMTHEKKEWSKYTDTSVVDKEINAMAMFVKLMNEL